MKFGSSHFPALLYEAFERPKGYTFYFKEKNIAKNEKYDDHLLCEHKIIPILLDPKQRVFEWVY